MLELLLAAQAALNLYQWDPATGPVFGYHVYVNGELVQTTYAPQAWLDIGRDAVVEVQAVDFDYQTGPVSDPSLPHEALASAVLREPPGCLADLDGDGGVSVQDVVAVANAYGTHCSCDGDLDGDLTVGIEDWLAVQRLFGETCE